MKTGRRIQSVVDGKRQPLYKKIKSDIANQIVAADLTPGDPLPTRHDLALRYRTTRATVDRAMQELSSDGLISGGSGRRTFVLGSNGQAVRSLVVVWNEPRQHLDMGDYFFGPMAQGIHQACADFKTRVSFRSSQPGQYAEVVDETQAQGMLVLRPDYSDVAALEALRDKGIPVVAVPGALGTSKVPSLASDNLAGIHQAVDHLASLGHKEIGLVSLMTAIPDHFERLQGFIAAMAKNQLQINPVWMLIMHDLNIAQSDEQIGDWLNSGALPTAIIALDLNMGLTVLRQLKAKNIRVPADVSLLHFDDSPVALHISPPTTVIRQDSFRLGYLGIQHLIELIGGTEVSPVDRLTTQLVVRESTAKPRAAKAGRKA